MLRRWGVITGIAIRARNPNNTLMLLAYALASYVRCVVTDKLLLLVRIIMLDWLCVLYLVSAVILSIAVVILPVMYMLLSESMALKSALDGSLRG